MKYINSPFITIHNFQIQLGKKKGSIFENKIKNTFIN
jgi:hypothetical protein